MIHNPMDTSIFNIAHDVTSSPTPGVNLTVEGIENARSAISAIRFKLVTDANAANRRVRLYLGNPALGIEIAASHVNHAANQTRYYAFGPGADYEYDLAATIEIIPIPDHLYLFEVWRIYTDILNIQVGDQISEVRWQMRYWTYEQ